MLSLLIVLLSSVPLVPEPCSPTEGTAICHCKQGSASACEAVRQTNPELADALEKAAAQRKPTPTTQGAQPQTQPAQQAQPAQAATPLTGQQHHAISKTIAKELSNHPKLKGRYSARDSRFVTQASDKAAHNGYQRWHRDLDQEVVRWLRQRQDATPQQFEEYLRSIYNRPEMRARFPNGL